MIASETFGDACSVALLKDALSYLDSTDSLTQIREKSVFYSRMQVNT